jgi:anaerobic magnesium-protoporphyrin IX monomethyl ester cyclase
MCALRLKTKNRKTNIAACGTHIAALPERSLDDLEIDFACYGEGFISVVSLARAIKEKSDYVGLSKVPGICFRKGEGVVKTERDRNLTGDEYNTKVIEPAWDLLGENLNLYRCSDFHAIGDITNRQPYASIYTSFNCIFRCNFCCISAPFGGNGYTKFSPKIVVDQIEKLVRKYGVKYIKIVDEMHVLDPKHVIGICDEIDRRNLGDDIYLWAYSRIDIQKTLDDRDQSLLDRMRQSGYRYLALGIEASSEDVRDGADKHYTNDDIVGVVRRIQSKGINLINNFIFGLPSDTTETMQQTLDMAQELNSEWVNMYCTMGYPGSQLHKQYSGSGLLPEENGIGWIGYSQHAYETFPLPTDTLTNVEVLRFRDNAFLKYFTDSSYLTSIQEKFGQDAVDYIRRMTNLPPPKKEIV